MKKNNSKNAALIYLILFFALSLFSFFHFHECGHCSPEEFRQCLVCVFIASFDSAVIFYSLTLLSFFGFESRLSYNFIFIRHFILKAFLKLRSPPSNFFFYNI